LTLWPFTRTSKIHLNINVNIVIKINVLPKLLLLSVILFMYPTIEKIIIIEDKTLKMPTMIPKTMPFAEIEFKKVFTREYKAKQADPIVVTIAAVVPIKKS
jgi:hypothetical protein